MRRRRLAWIVLPAGIIILAVVTLVISSYQKEMGIAAPGKGGPVTVAAVADAVAAASGAGATEYDVFSRSLTVAQAEAKKMPASTPADLRLRTVLTGVLDCLLAAREAWQTELDQAWDPAVDGSPGFWRTIHPSLTERAESTLSPDQVREWTQASADRWLQKAVDLVD